MKRPATKAVTLTVAAGLWGIMSDTAKLETIDTIRGKSYLAVQAAVRELQRKNLDVVGYKIQVLKEGNSVFVIFLDQHQPEGTLGSVGAKPGFEVELDARDLSVRRSNFVR